MLIADDVYGVRSTKSKSRQGAISHTVVVLTAILDSSIPFAFFLQISQLEAWYGLTIGIKLILCIVQRFKIHLGPVSAVSFYGLSCIILSSSILGGSGISDYIRVYAFVLSLFMTLSMIRRQNLEQYITICSYVIGISTVLYIYMVYTGHFQGKWDRYNYFADSHPNLGSEIIAMSVIYASCVLSPARLVAFSLPSMYATNLMQGRAGLIVCLLATMTGIFTRIENPRKRAALGLTAVVALILSFTLYHETTLSYLNTILLLNDEHRGVDTGYVGRDELWGGAWDAFMQSPIVGNGAGFEERLDVNPHNFFLYGLAFFGFLSLFVFGVIIYLYFDLFKKNRPWFSVLVITSIMFIFNDRFLNLNPYPFLLYVALFAHAQDGPDQGGFKVTPLDHPMRY